MATDGALTEMLAGIEARTCSVPVCERSAVSVVRQQDGSLFPVCESHAEKATALGFPVFQPDADPSCHEEHELTQPRVRVGDPVPAVRLVTLDREQRDGVGEVVDVSAVAQGKPVALVFGSYSVPKLRKHLGELESLKRRYENAVRFFLVYTKEIRFPETSRRPALVPHEPTTLADRAALARQLVDEFSLSLPVLIDGLDHEATRIFGAFPMRLYLIEASGRIAYQGALGPYMFQPSELESAIREQLA